jgi:hypothetical protein
MRLSDYQQRELDAEFFAKEDARAERILANPHVQSLLAAARLAGVKAGIEASANELALDHNKFAGPVEQIELLRALEAEAIAKEIK